MEAVLLGLIIIEALALAGLAVALRRLRRAQRDQCRAHEELVATLAVQTGDLAGLCAAAVNMDKRILRQEQRLGELHVWLEDRKTEERHDPPHPAAIDLIHHDADAGRRVAECGISREEANVLPRSHGDGEARD
jgi:hypothetical protein